MTLLSRPPGSAVPAQLVEEVVDDVQLAGLIELSRQANG
jgi:hypothetical protein